MLFPMIKGKDEEIDELILALEKEHDSMGQMIENLDPAVSTEDDLHELGMALDQHVRKEERVLFQMIQEKIGEKLLSLISY